MQRHNSWAEFSHTTRSWTALDASAVALASAERFREAADRARRALDLAAAAGNQEAASQIRERLRVYEEGTR